MTIKKSIVYLTVATTVFVFVGLNSRTQGVTVAMSDEEISERHEDYVEYCNEFTQEEAEGNDAAPEYDDEITELTSEASEENVEDGGTAFDDAQMFEYVFLAKGYPIEPGCGSPISNILIGFPLYYQETEQWCWAATAQMTMEFVANITEEQCAMANQQKNLTDCCDIDLCPNPATTGPCVQPGSSADVYTANAFTFNLTATGTALTWDEITDQIDLGLPTNFIWMWTGGGGHIMVAAGYKEASSGTQYVFSYNPAQVCEGAVSWITYADYVSDTSNSPTYTHGSDIYDLAH